MDISLALSVAVMVVGVILYFVVTNSKLVEVARLMFACGLLAMLLRFAGHASLHVGG